MSNSTLVSWHIEKSGEFWNATDTKEVAEKNKRVADDISNGLDTLFAEANKTNPDPTVVSQTVKKLDSSLEEVISVRIDTPKLQNATVNALALRTVLDEALEDYGIALGAAEGDGGDHATADSHDNSTTTTTTAEGTNATSTGPIEIVNQAAYQTSSGLVTAARAMFDKLRPMAPSNATSFLDEADKGLTDLQDAIADKAPADDVEMIVHSSIDPNLQAAFNLQVVPEFPIPVIGAIAAVIEVVAVIGRTRMFRTF